MKDKNPELYSLYFHIPFCIHRCAYCDFNTYAGQEKLIPEYMEAVGEEVAYIHQAVEHKIHVHTIYIGGGTPSLLPPNEFNRLFRKINNDYLLEANAEISLEANPGTVSEHYFQELRRIGINRLSLGVQSMQPDELHFLERIHDPFAVIEAVMAARQAGFRNINLDLIYGLPEQGIKRWKATLEMILDLDPEHLSLYSLTIEDHTPLGKWTRHGLIPQPDPDQAADMYDLAGDMLQEAGYEQYEISNWARPGFQCEHNLQYWHGDPYLGFGAGAHGYASHLRIANVLRIGTYIERMNKNRGKLPLVFPFSPATISSEHIPDNESMRETMLTRLRLTNEGVSKEMFSLRHGKELQDVFKKEIDQLTQKGLLEWVDNSLRLTKWGRLLGNQVFIHFVK